MSLDDELLRIAVLHPEVRHVFTTKSGLPKFNALLDSYKHLVRTSKMITPENAAKFLESIPHEEDDIDDVFGRLARRIRNIVAADKQRIGETP